MSLIAILGAMEAGKSLELLVMAHKYETKGLKPVVYSFKGDNRFGQGVIASRLGISRQANMFDTQTSFPMATEGLDFDVLMVDEAQFLTKDQVIELHKLSTQKTVICFGLRSDYKGQPFEGSAWLLALCDEYRGLHTMCKCGKPATMNMRLDAQGKKVLEGNTIEIGDKSYQSTCSACFYAG